MITQDWMNGSTPEQKNLWRAIPAIFAFNTVQPLYYQGTIAGTEFLVYDAAKLYFALEFNASHMGATLSVIGNVRFYNEADVGIDYYCACMPYWDATALKYIAHYVEAHNLYFSRFVASQLSFMKFNGYRLTIV